jgi:hypothetical protein
MSLMTALGIQETCLLRGDHYHNMSEVFPKKFGEHFFAIIKAYLKAMMESKTEEEWMSVYSQAKQRICFRPDKVDLLDGIYENPLYYSGYVLYNHPGSLNMKGDVGRKMLQQNKITPPLLLILGKELHGPSRKTFLSY